MLDIKTNFLVSKIQMLLFHRFDRAAKGKFNIVYLIEDVLAKLPNAS